MSVQMKRSALIAWMLSFLCFGCTLDPRGELRTPTYCVVVGANDAQGRELLAAFDLFAEQAGLESGGGVVARSYYTPGRAMELDVTTYLGPLGSEVTVYALQGDADRLFLDRLQGFLRDEIEPRWLVRHCEDVPGFDLPQRWG